MLPSVVQKPLLYTPSHTHFRVERSSTRQQAKDTSPQDTKKSSINMEHSTVQCSSQGIPDKQASKVYEAAHIGEQHKKGGKLLDYSSCVKPKGHLQSSALHKQPAYPGASTHRHASTGYRVEALSAAQPVSATTSHSHKCRGSKGRVPSAAAPAIADV